MLLQRVVFECKAPVMKSRTPSPASCTHCSRSPGAGGAVLRSVTTTAQSPTLDSRKVGPLQSGSRIAPFCCAHWLAVCLAQPDLQAERWAFTTEVLLLDLAPASSAPNCSWCSPGQQMNTDVCAPCLDECVQQIGKGSSKAPANSTKLRGGTGEAVGTPLTMPLLEMLPGLATSSVAPVPRLHTWRGQGMDSAQPLARVLCLVR